MSVDDLGAASWIEYRQLILRELTRLNEGQERIYGVIVTLRSEHDTKIMAVRIEHDTALNEVRIDIAKLQVKAAMWGALAGSLLGIMPTIVTLLRP